MPSALYRVLRADADNFLPGDSYIGLDMLQFDRLLTIAFGLISLLSLAGSVWCFVNALRVSGERDGDIKMFAWAAGTLIGLVVAGMSAAYILLPILFHYW